MSFFVYMAFFAALPYTRHKATQHFIEVYFRFAQTTVFLLPFYRIHNLSHSSMLCKLYFVLVNNVYIAYKNVELVPVLSSVFCYLLRFL